MRSLSTRWWDLCQQDDEIFVNKINLISSLLSVSYSARIFSSFVGRGMFLYLLTLLSVWIRRSEQNTWSWGQENNFWSSCSDSHPSSGWACCTGFLSPQELQVGWTGKKGSMVFSIEFYLISILSPAETKSEPSKLRREQIETLGHNRSHPAKKVPTGWWGKMKQS